VCGGLLSSMDLGETEPSLCSDTGLTLSADGREVSNVRAEEVLHTQKEEDHLVVALPAVKAADKVCYVCNNVVLTAVQACTLASALWQCVVWCLGVTLQRRQR
jgi:hypothetical protein